MSRKKPFRYEPLVEDDEQTTDDDTIAASDTWDLDLEWFEDKYKNVEREYGNYFRKKPAVGAILFLVKQLNLYLTNELNRLGRKIDKM